MNIDGFVYICCSTVEEGGGEQYTGVVDDHVQGYTNHGSGERQREIKRQRTEAQRERETEIEREI